MAQYNLYPLANSVDPVNDLFLGFHAASSTLQNYSRNIMLGLSSQPLGLTDTQSPTNKTFNNTTTITIKDSFFTIQNASSITKQAVFSAASITAGQTRTITIPDASGTLGLLGSTQTWSGVNTFSGSSWTGGTISNTSIAADTITGFTTSTSGNIYGIAVTSGVITGASTVGSAALVTNAVQANQIATTAITLGYTQITSSLTTTSTSVVQATGLSVTVTIPAGGRRIKITAFTYGLSNTIANNTFLSIWNGTVGSGTQLSGVQASIYTTNAVIPVVCMAVITPSAGSVTYNVGYFGTNAGTTTLSAATTNPAFILVEAI